MSGFSLEFFKSISKKNHEENISFSPASLNMAMAVVYSGSGGQTQKQISDIFGFNPQLDQFHPQYHAYFSEIMNISKDTLVEFNLANRVYFEKSYPSAINILLMLKNGMQEHLKNLIS
jgi:serine protease inhibitor